jgi:hypothetical protein
MPWNDRTSWYVRGLALLLGGALIACADLQQPAAPELQPELPETPAEVVQAVTCEASLSAETVRCAAPRTGARANIIGGQGVYVQLASSNVAYTAADSLFGFDVTIQNLLNEALGSPDGVTPDAAGIRIFIHAGPSATAGEGTITIHNADGLGTFTAAGQPYWQYDEILSRDEVSAAQRWELKVPPSVETFTFIVYVAAETQALLVINEVLVNPAGTTIESTGDWVEIYNAGTLSVDMQGLVIADSAASGRRPYHEIASSLTVPSGGYVVLGNTTNTTSNGGVPVDYAWGGALNLVNSLDAVKLARVWGIDTLTLDRTQYSSASTSAKDGISRELKNPALDNSSMDGSNWGDASVTSVYGAGGRGTPRAQNSVYTP